MTNPAKILIVDDNETNLNILNDLVTVLGHIPILAENGLSALAQMEKEPMDLVLLDMIMPEMDGYEVLNRMKESSSLRHIPVIMISAVDDMENIVRCIERGADDYLTKPFNPTLLKARIGSCLTKKRQHDQEEQYRHQIEDYNLNLESRVKEQVKEIVATQWATIFSLAKLAESRDPETGEHLQRLKEYCKILSEKLRILPKFEPIISDNFVENIYAAAPLHDIGKVGIPDRILLKPGKLTKEEFNIMKQHAIIGADALREVDQKYPGNNFVGVGIEIAETHHEKWDGTGYPHGLAGVNIPLVGRILAIADVYDAITSKRVYKEAFSHDKCREIILSEHGKHFDPDVVDAFICAEEGFISIRERHVDTRKTAIT
jgi:putative two-component system response regulator